MGEIAKLFLVFIIFLQCFRGMVSQTYRNSSAGLTAVPTDIPDGTTKISLHYNDIRTIEDSSFSYIDVSIITELVLFVNKIENISKDAFVGFTSLESLDLGNNKLRELELNCKDLPNLNRLDLQNNLLTAMPAFYGSCSSLQYLILSNSKIDRTTAIDFENITYIRSITLKSNKLVNFQSFHGSNILMSRTSEVLLSSNESTVIDARTFEGFDILYRIHIYENKVKYFSITSIDVPRLAEIYLYENEMEEFPRFYGMMNKLKYLVLNRNQISYISPESFENITNLETLDLSQNELMEIEINAAFPDLSSFDLEDNRLSVMPRMLGNYTKPLKLILRNNRLTSAGVLDFKANSNISSDGLLELDLADNLDLVNNLSQIMNYLFKSFPQMEYLGLSDLRLTEIPEAQYHGVQKITVDLTSNQITNLNEEHLKSISVVKDWTLDLGSNSIKSFPNIFPFLSTGSKRELRLGYSRFECEKLCLMLNYGKYPGGAFGVSEWSINNANLQTKITFPRQPCEPPSFDPTLAQLDLEQFLKVLCSGSFLRIRPDMFSVGQPLGRLLQRHTLTTNATMVDDCVIHCVHNNCSGFRIIRNECILLSEH